ncbi:MAG: hypothetical protein QM820_06600 [Minicystis sp.]
MARTTLARGAIAATIPLAAAIALAACSGGDETTATSSTTSSSSSDAATGTGGGGGAATGTGGGATTGTGGSGGTTNPPYNPAKDAPQVVTYGGKVLTSPKIQLIGYASDPMLPEVEKFIQELGTTSTWSQQTAEYGVGAFTALPAIALPETPPATIDDDTGNVTPFEANLAAQLSGPSPAWGAADASTVYLFLAPMGTDVLSAGHCCTDFLGYHWQADVGATTVPYSIVCNCPPVMGDTLTPLQWVTTTVIHEMVEAATDPFAGSDTAYAQSDDDHIAWTEFTGGEVADMCEWNEDTNVIPPGATYMIQRSWSNAAAKAGKNPCVPAPDAPYFNSIPVLSPVTLPYYGYKVPTQGVKIPVGEKATIDVQLYSEAPTTGPWTITAWDYEDYFGSGSPRLQLSLDKGSGQNGDTVKLTIEVLKDNKGLGGELFILESNLGGQQNLSVGVVVN